jgi:hypothetical protein
MVIGSYCVKRDTCNLKCSYLKLPVNDSEAAGPSLASLLYLFAYMVTAWANKLSGFTFKTLLVCCFDVTTSNPKGCSVLKHCTSKTDLTITASCSVTINHKAIVLMLLRSYCPWLDAPLVLNTTIHSSPPQSRGDTALAMRRPSARSVQFNLPLLPDVWFVSFVWGIIWKLNRHTLHKRC